MEGMTFKNRGQFGSRGIGPTSCQAKMKSLETKIAEMQVELGLEKKRSFHVEGTRCHVDLFSRMKGLMG